MELRDIDDDEQNETDDQHPERRGHLPIAARFQDGKSWLGGGMMHRRGLADRVTSEQGLDFFWPVTGGE